MSTSTGFIRSLVFGCISLVALTVAVAVVLQQPVFAAKNAYGMNDGWGYYAQSDVLGQPNRQNEYTFSLGIVPDWQLNGVTKDTFIAATRARLYGTSTLDSEPADVTSARAAAVIMMMLGVPGSTYSGDWRNGVTAAKNKFDDWSNMVTQYDAAWQSGAVTSSGDRWGVNFNDIYSGSTRDDIHGVKVVAGPTSTSTPELIKTRETGTINEQSVVFYNPDGSRFTINKKSLNLVGTLSPFPATIPAPPPTPSTPIPQTRPFFQTNGGDVVTGAAFSTDTVPCAGVSPAPHLTSAGVLGWNNNGMPDFAGAGSRYAVRAMGYIEDFASDQTAANTGSTELSLANVDAGGSVNTGTGLFGGLFANAPCVDYWGQKPDLSSLTAITNGTISSLPSGSYSRVGNLQMTQSQIQDGAQIVIYIEGNLAITGNITYQNTAWANTAAIPSVKFVVHGSIFIDKSITQLDGTYIAVPSTNGGTATNLYATPIPGTITTCSDAVAYTSYNPSDYKTNQIETACANKLVINGNLVAQQIWLLRAYGSLDTDQPAEVINYRPENWLAPSKRPDTEVSNNYQSINGLPAQL